MLRAVRNWLNDREYTDIAGYWREGQSQGDAAEALHELAHKADLAVP